MKNKLIGALEVALVIGTALLPIVAPVAGMFLACAAMTAAVGTLGTAALAGTALAGGYLGFVAGVVATEQSPFRMMGAAPRQSVAKDIAYAAQIPFKAVTKLFPGLSTRFNAAAGKVFGKKAGPGAAPAQPSDDQASQPKPDAPKAP